MTDFAGTVLVPPTAGDRGTQKTAVLKYTLVGALANTDTITWTNAVPTKKQGRIVRVELVMPEIDTNASPTGTAILGDGTDTDGYITTFNLGMPVQAPANGAQLIALGNGAVIGTATQASTTVVLTVNAAVATSATTGDIFVYITYEGIS